MAYVNRYKRQKKRQPDRVKRDIEDSEKIVREDVYDILVRYKSRGKAIYELEQFLNTLNPKALTKVHSKKDAIRRVLSDVDSYGINWEEA